MLNISTSSAHTAIRSMLGYFPWQRYLEELSYCTTRESYCIVIWNCAYVNSNNAPALNKNAAS